MNHIRYRKRISIFEVNTLYLLLGVGLLTFGAAVQKRELFSGLLITELVLILMPCLLFIKTKGLSIKDTLRLNRIGLKQCVLVILITIFTYPLAVTFQAIFIAMLNIFRDLSPSPVPLPSDGTQFIISFFIMAVAPGVCEEVMFRGLLLNSYRELGYKKSIILSALLFGIFHFNIMNLVGPTILGVVFAILVYKTNSLYSAIIGHITNNGIALTIGYFLNGLQNNLDLVELDPGVERGSLFVEFGSIVVIIIFLALCFTIVKSLIGRLSPLVKDGEEEKIEVSNFPNDTSPIDAYHNYEEVNFRIRTMENTRFVPVIIIVFIFLLINWLYFFV